MSNFKIECPHCEEEIDAFHESVENHDAFKLGIDELISDDMPHEAICPHCEKEIHIKTNCSYSFEVAIDPDDL